MCRTIFVVAVVVEGKGGKCEVLMDSTWRGRTTKGFEQLHMWILLTWLSIYQNMRNMKH